MRRRAFLGILSIVLAGLTVAAPARAEQDAGAFIMDMADRALTALTDPTLANDVRAERFRDLLREGLDIPHVAGRVLGPYVRRATDDEMAEFVVLLEENIVRKYAILFKGYSGETLELLGTKAGRRGAKVVSVRIYPTSDSPPVQTRWVVHDVDGALKVIDIVIESASMVTTQKEDFVSVIRRGDGKISALLDELRERNAELAQNVNG